MPYHVIDISSEECELTVKNHQLVCRLPNGLTRHLPLEDIGSIIINSFSANLHSSLIVEAARAKIALVVCDRFRPVSIVVPVQRGGDTLLTRSQIEAPRRFLDGMWMRLIEAKCSNQFDLLSFVVPNDEKTLADFKCAQVRPDVFKEGNCARIYWPALMRPIAEIAFRRDRSGGGVNQLLNYGYGVLECRVIQRLLAMGLDPMYGVGHVTRERSLPLAYDLMEPFRPAIDRLVLKYVISKGFDPDLSVDIEYKRYIQGAMRVCHPFNGGGSFPLEDLLDITIRSFREALVTKKLTRFKPWIRRSSEWDG